VSRLPVPEIFSCSAWPGTMLSPTANPPRVAGPTGFLRVQSAVGPSCGPVGLGGGVVGLGLGEVALAVGVGVTDGVGLSGGALVEVGAADVDVVFGAGGVGSRVEVDGVITGVALLGTVDVAFAGPLGEVSSVAAGPGSGDGVGVKEMVGGPVGAGSSALTMLLWAPRSKLTRAAAVTVATIRILISDPPSLIAQRIGARCHFQARSPEQSETSS